MPFHCDFNNRLMTGHLGNYMLNAADFHSRDRGFGFDYLSTICRAWVLSRFAIEIVKMPKAYDKFYIETWVENAMRYFTKRNFKVSSLDGQEVYAYGKSIWAMIDTRSRQPQNILEVNDGLINNYIEKEYPCPIADVSRVVINDELQKCNTLQPKYTDLDINGHVNSVKYIDHILDLMPAQTYKETPLKRFEIAYVAEAREGDTLNFYKEETPEAVNVKITKGDGEETETCRARMLFN